MVPTAVLAALASKQTFHLASLGMRRQGAPKECDDGVINIAHVSINRQR